MNLSKETGDKLEKFIKQSTNLIGNEEMTYFEKIALHANIKWMEAKKTAAKFKRTSEKNNKAQEDLISYMTDYLVI